MMVASNKSFEPIRTEANQANTNNIAEAMVVAYCDMLDIKSMYSSWEI